MKSKLFLSLSLLTAIFSVKADSLSLTNQSAREFFYVNPTQNLIPFVAQASKAYMNKQVAKAALPLVGIAGTAAAVAAGLSYSDSVKQAELPNRSYFQIAKDGIVSGYNAVATKASELYTNATYENMKNATISGFNTAKTFAMENPYKTAGAVAGTAAVVYGAYKLYNSDMFAKSSKKQVTPVVSKPKVNLPRKPFVYGV